MQWYSPDLLKILISDASITKLGGILNCEKKKDTWYYLLSKQQRTLKLLVDIVNSDFDTMKQCLNIIDESNPGAVQSVRKLFKYCQENGVDTCLCEFCKIRNGLNIKHFNVYLWQHGIITSRLFELIGVSSLDKKSETKVWNDLENELQAYSSQQHIVEALLNTLKNHPEEYSDLAIDIRGWLENPQSKFICQCHMLYLKALKRGAQLESDPETNAYAVGTSKYLQAVSSDHSRRKNKSKSAITKCSTRKKSTNLSESKDQKSKCKALAKHQTSDKGLVSYQAPLRENVPSSVQATTDHITIDRKKSTQVLNINNVKTVNVGNKYMKIGNVQLSETSNDTESCTPNDSESDVGTGLPTNKTELEVQESINVSRKIEFFSTSQTKYYPAFEPKTSMGRRRTVSEGAHPNLRIDQARGKQLDKAVNTASTYKPEVLAINEDSKSGKTEKKLVIPKVFISEACIRNEDLQETKSETATNEFFNMDQNEAQEVPASPIDSVTTCCGSERYKMVDVKECTVLYSKEGKKEYGLETLEISDFETPSNSDGDQNLNGS